MPDIRRIQNALLTIGSGASGSQTLRMRNTFNMDLVGNPTANRVLTLPNKTDTLAGMLDLSLFTQTTFSTSRTLTQTDAGQILRFDGTVANTTVTLPTGMTNLSRIYLYSASDTPLSVVPGAGAFMYRLGSSALANFTINVKDTIVTLFKVNADSWVIDSVIPEAWTNCSFLNSWANQFITSRFRKETPRLTSFQVRCTRVAAPVDGEAIFNVPTQYRPTQAIFFPVYCSGNNKIVEGRLLDTGNFDVIGADTIISNQSLFFTASLPI
jgi:hypothetical protein